MKTPITRACVLPLMFVAACIGTIRAQAASAVIFSITNVWRYNQTDSLDAINWMTNNYDDSNWPSGPGLLYCETNALVFPRNTLLDIGRNTYYFRTHFNLTNASANKVLVFSNKIDDGAVFYLNG